MAGAYFVTGFGTTYFGGNREPESFDVDAAKNDDWEEQIQHIPKLFKSLDWRRLEPHNELVSAAVPRGEDRRHLGYTAPPTTAYWALADPGRQYVVYVRGCDRKITLSLGKTTEETFSLRRFDPRSEEFADLGSEKIRSRIEFQPPDGRDRVVILTANGQNIPPNSRRPSSPTK